MEIFDVEGNKVAEAEGASGTITIPDARLWWPGRERLICTGLYLPLEKISMRKPLASVQ